MMNIERIERFDANVLIVNRNGRFPKILRSKTDKFIEACVVIIIVDCGAITNMYSYQLFRDKLKRKTIAIFIIVIIVSRCTDRK